LDNSFCNKDIVKLKGLTPAEFDLAKRTFLKGADANLLLYAEKIKGSKPLIVTEETKTNNDGKFFKKIPENCFALSHQYCDLPSLLRDHLKLNVDYSN